MTNLFAQTKNYALRVLFYCAFFSLHCQFLPYSAATLFLSPLFISFSFHLPTSRFLSSPLSFLIIFPFFHFTPSPSRLLF